MSVPVRSLFSRRSGVALLVLVLLPVCNLFEATDAMYRKNLANFDRELARAPESLQPEMKALRSDFDRRRAASTVPASGTCPELTALSRDVSSKRAVYSEKVTKALGALALPDVRAHGWIGDFRAQHGAVEERVLVSSDGQFHADLYVRIGGKDRTEPNNGTIVAARKDAIVYRPVGLGAKDETFDVESPVRRGPDGAEFVRAGRVFRAK